ncbi:hypothetical protein [Deinococcus arenicola]|uniref:Uncharacterized protein n=1 Tax=Deinococcus arenicola TaxID=2994950 RepID=A0ABU4DM50_9DEIO|nr:hypothetical protein [Deinococcus sp. ZS9-10]MDV6373502.1 hypothetical protein [Deinococcus sp. ZS9-10]
MRRLLIIVVGLTGLIASCGGGGVIVDPKPSDLRLTKVDEFKTQYTAKTDLNDDNGNKIASAGDYIICNNRGNRIRVAFDWTGDLSSVQLRLKGLRTGEVTTTSVINYPSGFTDGGVETTLAPGIAPQIVGGSLNSQSITIMPVEVTKLYGRSYLQMQIFDKAGRNGKVAGSTDAITFQSVTALPVVECAADSANVSAKIDNTRTEYRLNSASGTFIACDSIIGNIPGRNHSTQVAVRFSLQGNSPIHSVNIGLRGQNSSQYDSNYRAVVQAYQLASAGNGRYKIAFDANSSTGAFLPQSIIVSPTAGKVKVVAASGKVGAFYPELTIATQTAAFGINGRVSSSIDVYSNCNVIQTTNEDI